MKYLTIPEHFVHCLYLKYEKKSENETRKQLTEHPSYLALLRLP